MYEKNKEKIANIRKTEKQRNVVSRGLMYIFVMSLLAEDGTVLLCVTVHRRVSAGQMEAMCDVGMWVRTYVK